MSEVFCAGIIVVDHIAAPVDHLPAAGELVLTEECFLAIGGCASNVAVDLRRMEVSVSVGGLVGKDEFGDFAAGVLDEAGVDTSTLARTDRAATSQTLILNVRGQDRRFVHHVGANQLFGVEHLPMERIAKCRVLYVGGFFLMGITGAALAPVFRQAKEAGVVTVLDVVTPSGAADHLQNLAPVLPYTDYFLPNEDEGRVITGLTDPVAQAERFLEMGVGAAVVTCGGGGSVYIDANRRLRAGAFPTEFVDGTGGGDAFDAGFICGLLESAPIERRLAVASALGASCVRKSGATAGVFRRSEAEAFLRDHPLMIEQI